MGHDRKFTEDFPEKSANVFSVFDFDSDDEILKKRKILELLKIINENLIGRDENFRSPFGLRRVFYCDHTASSKALKFIEDFIQEEVLPCYGNTHSSVTFTAQQSTLYLHEARDIIRNATQASERDAVIFCGNGTFVDFQK